MLAASGRQHKQRVHTVAHGADPKHSLSVYLFELSVANIGSSWEQKLIDLLSKLVVSDPLHRQELGIVPAQLQNI